MNVRDIMDPEPVTVGPDDDVEHGRLVGVVTRVDVLDALYGERAAS